jgi:hypothetical protein
LFGDDVLDIDLVGMKNVVVVYVTDLADGLAHDFVDGQDSAERFVLGQTGNRDLAANDNDVAFGVGLAGDPTMSILRDAGIKDRVGNCVANFVGVTFTDGFGRKNVTARHNKKWRVISDAGQEQSSCQQHIDQS